MPNKIAVLRSDEEGPCAFIFECPGCRCCHWFQIRPVMDGSRGDGPVWSWNGDYTKPTVSPSILVRSDHLCHSFVREGRIEFLSDCSHKLAGKSVELPDWETQSPPMQTVPPAVQTVLSR